MGSLDQIHSFAVLGVRNALLSALRSQFPGMIISSEASYPPSLGGGVIIGGGATTRSATHALTLLGLSPIFLINRDAKEVRAVQESFSHLNIIHLRNPEDVETHLVQSNVPTVLMIVGAIRELSPSINRHLPHIFLRPSIYRSCYS